MDECHLKVNWVFGLCIFKWLYAASICLFIFFYFHFCIFEVVKFLAHCNRYTHLKKGTTWPGETHAWKLSNKKKRRRRYLVSAYEAKAMTMGNKRSKIVFDLLQLRIFRLRLFDIVIMLGSVRRQWKNNLRTHENREIFVFLFLLLFISISFFHSRLISIKRNFS